MAIIKSVRGYSPQIGKNVWLADHAVLVGDVILSEDCTVWFGAVVRGDVNSIIVGKNSNIQDNATIHGTFETAATKIGDNVTIGHNAMIHGCTLEDEVLIGMGAIVMDHSIIKKGCIIAAGAVVLEKTVTEEGMLYAGVPAKPIKKVEGKNLDMMKRIAGNYVKYASWFKDEE
jgi:carbonic anhydrase/acetyltransferase-like protein (isoleucine patch superfamily)